MVFLYSKTTHHQPPFNAYLSARLPLVLLIISSFTFTTTLSRVVAGSVSFLMELLYKVFKMLFLTTILKRLVELRRVQRVFLLWIIQPFLHYQPIPLLHSLLLSLTSSPFCVLITPLGVLIEGLRSTATPRLLEQTLLNSTHPHSKRNTS